ncbi:MATE family efflux transporter ASCRUDRAFT_22327, partial [Ascoidea rubescens DSM 1968]
DEQSIIINAWEHAILNEKVKTSPLREFKAIFRSSSPLMITFLLQYSYSAASIFSVGHIGKIELGAVTLGSMTANITAISIIHGLATCLDTLCSQAYGANRYHLVGAYCQRCVALLFTIIAPIILFWFIGAEYILNLLINDSQLSKLAAAYLKVISIGIPGYVLFEAGKRFLQSQGIFHASTYILIVCAPLNAIMNYLFVWNSHIGIGYLGAPLAVAINYWLMPIGLLIYTLTNKNLINPLKCWNGLHIKQSFKGWNRMFKLALSGLIMVFAEFFAFEVLTLGSSHLGITALATNSVIASVASLSYQIPFAVSIALSTRLANFIGASLPYSSQICAKVGVVFGTSMGITNGLVIYCFRHKIARAFTSDEDVISELIRVFPIVSSIQIFDALNAVSAGVLRGEGLQHIGSIVNLAAYYIIGLPLAFVLAFKFNFQLEGLWMGIGIALLLIGVVQCYYGIVVPDWNNLIKTASDRTEAERS